MRRLLIFLSLLANVAVGQVIEDSLLQEILSLPNDTEKVNRLHARGVELRNTDPALSYKYARLCEACAKNSASKKHVAKSYNLLGILSYKKGHFKEALRFHKQALELRKQCGDILGVAVSQTNLGNIYTDFKLYNNAETTYLSALKTYNELNNTKQTANCLINLGVLKQECRLSEVALEYFNMALKKGEELNDYEIRSMCLNNLAVIYAEKGNFEKAIALNEDALKIRNLMDNNLEVTDSYLNLAVNYIQLKIFDKAKFCLDTAIFIASRYDYFESQTEAQKIYSEYYVATKNYEQAYLHLQRYYAIKDSLVLEQENEKQVDKEMKLESDSETANKPFNFWLLALFILILVGIPYYFIRFKR